MKYGYLQIAVATLGLALLGGCGGSGGVHAVAPGTQDQLVGVAPSTGDYSLYRATGFSENHDTHVEPVWSVHVDQGQKIGFRWAADEAHKYDAQGGYHLIAFAGGEARDMGAFVTRDMKYVWAGSNGDVTGYFHGKGVSDTMKTLTLQ